MSESSQQDREHIEKRERLARQAYINWRMRDVPSIYQELMPYSLYTIDLWKAEKAIRSQLADDQQHLQSPWRQLGPIPSVLDHDGMESRDLVDFALAASVPLGWRDIPKPGREAEVFEITSQWTREYEQSEEGQLRKKHAELFDQLRNASDAETRTRIAEELEKLPPVSPAPHVATRLIPRG